VTRAPSLSPFRFRDGRLVLENLALAELATALDGRAAWVLGHRALSGALKRAARAAGGAVSVPVGALGPREALTLAAQAGCWARVASPHELTLARAAGFAPDHIVAGAPVLEDGLLRDALAAGVAVLEARGEDAPNAERIARALGHKLPPTTGAPPDLPANALRRAGGLLAPLLAAAPALALDAVWEPRGRGRVAVAALAGPPESVGETSLRGLSGPVAPALLVGAAQRGGWVVLPDTRAAAPQRPDLAHALPATVLVRGGAWRLLERRPLPESRAE
jgi:hypothetical protein